MCARLRAERRTFAMFLLMCITFQLMWSECNKKYTKNRLKEYVHTSDVCEQWKRFCLLWLFLLLILVSKTSVMYGGHNPHLKVYLELQQNDNSAVWLNEIKFKFRRWLIRLTQTQISLRQACKYKTRTMDFGLWSFHGQYEDEEWLQWAKPGSVFKWSADRITPFLD